jgi:hypothetical protein
MMAFLAGDAIDPPCPARVSPTRRSGFGAVSSTRAMEQADRGTHTMKDIDPATRTELEAAAFRRLVAHLRERTDVQNIDLMNLAGFCRNCLSNWLKEAADSRELGLAREESREWVYGMPYDEWKARHQNGRGSSPHDGSGTPL